MALQKDYESPSTGATASYHYVAQVTLDRVSNIVNATVASYLSADAKNAGKFALYTQQITITGLPPDQVNVFDYAEQQLIVPDNGAAITLGNRYVFAGAQIVA